MSDPARPATCGIAVMAKASAPGRTKTRMVPPLSFDEAAAFNTAFLQDVAANIERAAAQQSIAGYMAFGPAGEGAFFDAILPPSIGRFEAWFPDFGTCLLHAVDHLLARRHEAACVLNADSPTLPTALLTEAAEVLARPGDRAVLGPSTDGGYYLLGLKQSHKALFEDVTWSTDQVAEQTLRHARRIGLDVYCLPAWYDVDDKATLRQLHADLFDGRETPSGLNPHAAEQTRALMARLKRDARLAERLGLAA